ncbi:MAG TPA: HAMP domain-containing protein, partial [Negativicutes bacterium]|nr:HAMP domain-containing protein [Negativicutes bacterium]
MIEKVEKLNITQKFLVLLVILSIIPLLVLSVMTYNIANAVINRQATASANQLIEEKEKYVSLLTEEVDSLIANISSVEDIENVLSSGSVANDSYNKLATQAKIGYILSGYTNLKGLVSIDIFSVGGEHYHVGDTLNIEATDKALKDKLFEEAAAYDGKVRWIGIEKNVNMNSKHEQVIVAARTIKSTDVRGSGSKTVGLLVVNYDVDVFYDHFKADGIDKNTLMITDTKDRIIFYPERKSIGKAINRQFIEKLKGESGFFQDIVDGHKTFVSYKRSPKLGWMIINFIPVKVLTDETAVIRTYSFFLLIICLAMVMYVSIYITRYIVVPIRSMTNLFKELKTGTIDLSIRLKEKSSDEIGELIRWFNTFLESMGEKLRTEEELLKSREQYKYVVN